MIAYGSEEELQALKTLAQAVSCKIPSAFYQSNIPRKITE